MPFSEQRKKAAFAFGSLTYVLRRDSFVHLQQRGILKIMNKAELITKLAEQAELSKSDATKALGAVIEIISASLAKGEPVVLIGFGSFQVRDRAARAGHNPRTGKKIEIAASRQPTFKAGRTLKDRVA